MVVLAGAAQRRFSLLFQPNGQLSVQCGTEQNRSLSSELIANGWCSHYISDSVWLCVCLVSNRLMTATRYDNACRCNWRLSCICAHSAKWTAIERSAVIN